MARSAATSVQADDAWRLLINQLTYVWAWIDKHMDPNCVEDATESQPGRPALHFKSIEAIDGRHFCFELEKMPVGNVVKGFHATWLPFLDSEIREGGVHSSSVREGGVMWLGNPEPITLIVVDRQYVLSLQVVRI